LLAKIFPSALIDQEFTAERWVPIPDEVRQLYERIGRPTPLRRAEGFERAIGTGAKIYYKFEGALPGGSHKLNTAIAQAYFAKQDGAKEVVTETGAGQWGLAVAIASSLVGLKATIFMTRSSYISKRGRLTFMRLFGAEVYPSPSRLTELGRKFPEDHPGSLGIAIGEAVEYTLMNDGRKYLPGSVMEFVLMHQTVIGLEAMRQLEEEPDYIIACVGGGSNFGGITYPFIGAKLRGEGYERTRFIAAESAAAPKLTKGEYRYDYPDTARLLPMIRMYTLGVDYVPPPIHAAGLRYHGAAPSLSLLAKLGIVEPVAYDQSEVFEAARIFARAEGIVPAPESAHAIRAAMDIAKRVEPGTVILINLSGHGLLDVDSYEKAWTLTSS